MLGLPDVRSCCGCCSVELGAQIIAWIQLIAGVLFLIYQMEYLIAVFLSERVHTARVYTHMVLCLLMDIYPMLQGTLLLIGLKKKKAGVLLTWIILAFICEMFLTTIYFLFLGFVYGLFGKHLVGVAIIYLGGIQNGISFFFIVIVSTCRKNILRRNALFEYGVIYTPDAVEILTPKQRTGLIPTNPQFDYAALDTPEDK